MKKSRVLWIIWLILTAGFGICADQVAGYLLFLVSLVLPLIAGAGAFRLKKKLKAQLSVSAYGEKNKPAEGKLLLENTGFVPAGRIICRICCENLLTGEKQEFGLHMAVLARQSVSTAFKLSCRHAGKYRVSLKSIECCDPFGLFLVRLMPGTDVVATGLIAPQMFSVETQIAYGETTNMDSDEYSMKKAGNDPSETFAIREYQPGDRIRQIHWKLTEKMGDLMVRDYGLPIQNTILLLLETGEFSDEKADPDCLDALAEGILSVSAELISQQIVHSIGWQNHEENVFSCVEIETEEDLNAILPEILGAVPGKDALSVAEHYMATREQLEFAHMVVFATAHQDSLGVLADQCILTEVICGYTLYGYDQMDGVAMIGASPDQLPEMIAYLEI